MAGYFTIHTQLSHTPPYLYTALSLLISTHIHIGFILGIDVYVGCISGYGLGERIFMVKYYYACKVGYATLSPDLPKS